MLLGNSILIIILITYKLHCYIILLVKFKGTGEEKGVYITFDDVKNYLYGYYERLEPSKQIEMIKLGSIIPNLYSLFSYIVRG